MAFGVVFAVHALDFYGSVPDFRRRSGGGTLLDVKPAFSEAELYDRVAAYGAEGRSIYAFRNKTVDVVLPLSVLPFLILIMLEASRVAAFQRVPRLLLLAVPAAYVVFDFAENAVVVALLAHYPLRAPGLAAVLPYLTTIKRAAMILALLIPLAAVAWAWFSRRSVPARTLLTCRETQLEAKRQSLCAGRPPAGARARHNTLVMRTPAATAAPSRAPRRDPLEHRPPCPGTKTIQAA